MYDPTRPPLPPDMMQIASAPTPPASGGMPELQRGQLMQPTQGPDPSRTGGVDMNFARANGLRPGGYADLIRSWLATMPQQGGDWMGWLAQRPDHETYLSGGYMPPAPAQIAPVPPPQIAPTQIAPVPQAPQVQPLPTPVTPGRTMPAPQQPRVQQFDRNPYSTPRPNKSSGGFFGARGGI